MPIHTVIWEHPVLGVGQYFSAAASRGEAAEECADIFAGQAVRIRVWLGQWETGAIHHTPDYEIDNG